MWPQFQWSEYKIKCWKKCVFNPINSQDMGTADAALLDILQIEGIPFPSSVKPPGTSNTFFLAGAGVRGLEINGNFVKFTSIGVYFEESTSLLSLSPKWKGKTASELSGSVKFFQDVVTGPFEKFTRVTMLLPLTGEQYSGKVSENCERIWKLIGIYTDAEAEALEKFKEAFKDKTFPPGASILFTQLPAGDLSIAFSEDWSAPHDGETVVISNKPLSEAVLESIIGEHGVSPMTKENMAERLAGMLDG